MSSIPIPFDPKRPNLAAIALAALGKIAEKQQVRDHLASGSRHVINLALRGDVDGTPVEQSLRAILNVGHDQERASSATPNQAGLVAFILSKLNGPTRELLLRQIPEEFVAAGNQLPQVSDELRNLSSAMLKRLRAKQTVRSRGAVRCEYQLLEAGKTMVA